MADTTTVSYTCAPANEYLANRGIKLELGPGVIEYAPRSNTNITATGTKGWRPVGVLENIPKIADAIETFQAKVGAISKILATLQTGRAASMPISFMAPDMIGRMFADLSTLTVAYPSSPVATTIDETTPAATQLSVVVNAVTGFAVGDKIEIVTGDSTYGTQKEYTTIKSIDATAKRFDLDTPIIQLPVDGAAVNKVKSFNESMTVCPVSYDYQLRLVRWFHTDRSVEVLHMPNWQHKQINPADPGDGKVATKYGFEIELLPEPILTSGVISDYKLYNKYRIYS